PVGLQRAAAEVDGEIEGAGDQELAGLVEGDGASVVDLLAAEGLGPQVIAGRRQLDHEDVLLAGGLCGATAEIDGVPEPAGGGDVAEGIDGDGGSDVLALVPPGARPQGLAGLAVELGDEGVGLSGALDLDLAAEVD